MKSTINISIVIFSALFFLSCKKDKPAPPVVSTSEVTEISYTTAVSGGNVSNEGGSPVISKGICWNTSPSPLTKNNKTTENGDVGSFSSNITGLTPNTLYYIRAYATNIDGTSYGDQLTFTTSQVQVPVLETASINSITQTTAISGGNIVDDMGGTITERGVCWSTSENPSISGSKTSDGTGTGSFTSTLTGLTGNTTYYLRSFATNSAGTQYGNQITFKTGPAIPSLTTEIVSSVSFTSCSSGGNITSDGGAPVTVRGVCWSTSENPTTSGNKTENGTGTGVFEISISGLTAGTTYYFRAYATNSAGTQYGNQVSLTTYPLNATDADGNVYDVVLIGTQLWMKENLKTTRYRNGELIGSTTPSTLNITSEPAPKYQWAYEGNESNVATYGRLYTWYAATDNRHVCPSGWHVPTDAEWTDLTNYLVENNYGFEGEGVDIAKSLASTSLWDSDPNQGNIGYDRTSNNTCGFTALPAGYRPSEGGFYSLTYYCSFWASTEHSAEIGWQRILHYRDSDVVRSYNGSKRVGVSVRCLKD